jgi:hypothetical protein
MCTTKMKRAGLAVVGQFLNYVTMQLKRFTICTQISRDIILLWLEIPE